MGNRESHNHQLLIQKLLVSTHYLTLFRDEIILVERTPSLLGDSFSPIMVQSELGAILTAVDELSQKEQLIRSTFWYDEPSFRLMNLSLDIVGGWIAGVDRILALCESQSVFQAILGDKRPHVFGILIDVFTSLKITNLSLKEESQSPHFYPLFSDNQQALETTLLEDAEAVEEVRSEYSVRLMIATKDTIIKQAKHCLFDSSNMTYVIDQASDLKAELQAYNVFDSFKGVFADDDEAVERLEEVLETISQRDDELFDESGKVTNPQGKQIHLILYCSHGYLSSSPLASLYDQLKQYGQRQDFAIWAYQAYESELPIEHSI